MNIMYRIAKPPKKSSYLEPYRMREIGIDKLQRRHVKNLQGIPASYRQETAPVVSSCTDP